MDMLYDEATEDLVHFTVSSEAPNEFLLSYDRQQNQVNHELEDSLPSALQTENFQYLSAERIGPRTSFPVPDDSIRYKQQLGIQGEYTIHFLETFGSKKNLLTSAKHPNAISQNIRGQTEAWLSEISPGLRLDSRHHGNMDLVNLEYSLGKKRDSGGPYSSTNVGFGITNALPVVVALVAAQEGSVIFLENPEAHLHPRGQIKMTELMSRVAAAGAQLYRCSHAKN